MVNPIFTGKIEKGRLILDRPSFYLVSLSKLEGKYVELVLRKKRSKRSDQANRYYWGVVVEILAGHLGYDKDSLHDALKEKFLSSHERDGHGLIRIGSTAKLNTSEFNDYIEQIKRWSAEHLQVYVPDPGQIDY